MQQNHASQRITLTREEFYEMIWSEPMTKIAARFQLSDVALRKRCLKHRIPMPGRGYWRKVETGTRPKRIALPKVANAHPIIFDIQPVAMGKDQVSIVDQAFLDHEAAHPIVVGPELVRPDSVTKAVSRDLKGQKPDDYGAIRSRAPDSFQVRLHPSSRDRVLAIVDALAKACRDRGFAMQDGKTGDRFNGHAAIVVDGVALRPVLDERMRRASYRMTEEELARRRRGAYVYTPTYSYEPTGELTLKIEGAFGTGLQTSWKDTRHHKIETRLNEVIIALRALANNQLEEQRKAAERKRRYDLIQQQRAELRGRIAAEQQAVKALEADVAAWGRAEKLRAYIAAVELRCAEAGELDARADWLAWARQQADRLDPLATSPSSILDIPEQDYQVFPIWQMQDDG